MSTASIDDLFVNNRTWASRMERERPGFFTDLMKQQQPKFMWVGCSDSRVPANQITGLDPGQIFVHRNVANVVVPTDLNSLSTIQFAVDQLHVEHIMVVGHYGCGGVQAALQNIRVGLADNWIRHVKDVRDRHHELIERLDPQHHLDALCELNVVEQVMNVAQTTVVLDAWKQGQALAVHGWCYGLKDGLIKDLKFSVRSTSELETKYKAAVASITRSELETRCEDKAIEQWRSRQAS
ncbi:carbonate dehydratase [Acidovorax sp. MR-S7]|uniref:carbonate dehydratase n=1 Tax=Acidovorax sp. MR-S7 TaxID=1268622 RepID=UPI0003A08FC2|nr:carbonate dehydratase [Acidovorax sp. MR-S7]GAD21149.1 carbonic anhydrase [Acidovorax sp. MR-S7]